MNSFTEILPAVVSIATMGLELIAVWRKTSDLVLAPSFCTFKLLPKANWTAGSWTWIDSWLCWTALMWWHTHGYRAWLLTQTDDVTSGLRLWCLGVGTSSLNLRMQIDKSDYNEAMITSSTSNGCSCIVSRLQSSWAVSSPEIMPSSAARFPIHHPSIASSSPSLFSAEMRSVHCTTSPRRCDDRNILLRSPIKHICYIFY